MAVHTAIVQHMIEIAHFMLGHHINGHSSVQEYIEHYHMDRDSKWGPEIEILTLAHLLKTSIMSYSVQHKTWQCYGHWTVDRSLLPDYSQMSLYIIHSYDHFEVACSVRKQK